MSKLLFIDRSRSCMFCSPLWPVKWWFIHQLSLWSLRHLMASKPAAWPLQRAIKRIQVGNVADSSFPDEKEWRKHMKHSLIVDPHLELMCLGVQRVTLMDRCRWHRTRERWYSSWCIEISIPIGSLASRVFNHYHQLQNLFPRIFNNIILIEKHRKAMKINHIKSFVKVP